MPAILLANMADNHEATWTDDENLKEVLTKYVQQGLQRSEALDFLRREFPEYAWSIRSLDRRLRHFNIFYNDRSLEVQDVMSELDPQGLEARGNVGAKRQRKKGNFTTRESNWVHSLDGHDKLMGYQNSTFPLAVYGCMDTASRKLLWLKVWVSNHEPKLIGRWYLEHLYETKIISVMLRVDKGTETGTMATMHAFLRRHHNDMDPHETVIYGPSTSNQVWKGSVYFLSKFNW